VYTPTESEVKAARSLAENWALLGKHPGFCIDVQIKELREKGFVRV
jgi:hypothetical protein